MSDEKKIPIEKFGCCTLCDSTLSYWVLPDGTTTMDRGEFLGHRDYLTTGFDTAEEAEKALIEYRLGSPERLALKQISDSAKGEK
jgi:hypothetical protein